MVNLATFIHSNPAAKDFQPKIEDSFLVNRTKASIYTGWKVQIIRVLMWLNVVWIAFKMYRDPLETWKKLKYLIVSWSKYRNKNHFIKHVKIGKRYYMNMNAPGWPSRSFNRFIKHQILKSGVNGAPGIHTLILAITKKCGFQCEHCFEWNRVKQAGKPNQRGA